MGNNNDGQIGLNYDHFTLAYQQLLANDDSDIFLESYFAMLLDHFVAKKIAEDKSFPS